MEYEAMNAGSNNPEREESSVVESPNESSSRPVPAFPDEPFACPNCGQMLAPSCRTCPSCREAIDPNEIARPEIVIPIAEQVISLPSAPKEYARCSWGIFFATLATWLVVAFTAEALLGYERSQFARGGLVILSSLWVFHDARERNIPKPLRWSIGSILLWIVFCPWYLARRRTPKAAYRSAKVPLEDPLT
ncbi:MAG: zinc ribbon domain-containing protein [Acidobacteriota bacterium]